MDGIVDALARELGLSGLTLLVVLFFVSKACNLVARLIPEDATGWKATVRKACKVIGLYVSSRVSSGVSVQDVAKGFVDNGGLLVKRNPLGQFKRVEPIVGHQVRDKL
jgi:hypothetical protein